MWLTPVLHHAVNWLQPMMKKAETQIKAWTKPAPDSLIPGTAAHLIKSKSDLIAENALLRQQRIVFKRQAKQPKLSRRDRGLLVLLTSRVREWRNGLVIVKPETLLKWHRQGFKLFWRRQSKGIARRPRLSEETIALIQRMAVENRWWGSKRIRGELLKLGIRVNKGTVRHNMWQARRKLPPQHLGQT